MLGQDERVTHPICVDCTIQTRPNSLNAATTLATAIGRIVEGLTVPLAFHACLYGIFSSTRLMQFRVEFDR
ncbi:DUF7558 family protein [Halogeometricum pallidum]